MTTVAVVGDDEAIRDSIASLLERAGYRVRAFENGDDFLAYHLPGETDCVVLDIRMQGTDGLGGLKALASGESLPPILVLTGHGAIPAAVEAMKLGATDFLEKPFPSEDLLDAIGRALASGPRGKPGAADPEAMAKVETLSQRQLQVLQNVLMGRPNKVIAHELGVSIRTVEAYRAQVLEKFGVRGMAAAVRLAMEAGMLDSR